MLQLFLGFCLGVTYLALGILLTMVLDTRTRYIERLSHNKDRKIMLIILLWPLALPYAWLSAPRLAGQGLR